MKFGFLAVLVIIALAIFVPFIFIWAWNALYGALYTIPYTWKTWLSVLIMYAFFNGKVAVERK